MYTEYLKNKRIIRLYTSGIAFFMFLRGTDLLTDFISEIGFNDQVKWYKKIVDVSLITFYFLENAPSLIIISILYQKIKGKNGLSGSHESEETSIQSLETFLRQKTDDYWTNTQRDYTINEPNSKNNEDDDSDSFGTDEDEDENDENGSHIVRMTQRNDSHISLMDPDEVSQTTIKKYKSNKFVKD